MANNASRYGPVVTEAPVGATSVAPPDIASAMTASGRPRVPYRRPFFLWFVSMLALFALLVRVLGTSHMRDAGLYMAYAVFLSFALAQMFESRRRATPWSEIAKLAGTLTSPLLVLSAILPGGVVRYALVGTFALLLVGPLFMSWRESITD